jgi:predicted ATPase/signal transduction histidine kinase
VKEKETFEIPERIYGREKQNSELTQSLNRVKNSKCQTIFLSGPSGIGKTALVKNLFQTISNDNGQFLSGKFDQINIENIGGPLVNALSDYFKMVLTEPFEVVEKWKYELKQCLGINAKVITDIIPELEVIMGQQPEPASLGPSESLTRFEILFTKVFSLIGSFEDRPIIIFIDDLQWASARSINLINNILNHQDLKNILFIGAYRDNEVDSSHPIEQLIGDNSTIDKTILTLPPLEFNHIKELTIDTIGDNPTIAAFTDLILKKTAGNPFHVRQFLKHLFKIDLLQHNGENSYSYDLSRIEEEQITDNVVNILINQMKNLTEETQLFISSAAAIGNRFSLQQLSSIIELSPGEAFDIVEICVKEKYIYPIEFDKNIYKFSHDRIQEASYRLLNKEEQSKIHNKIAKQLIFLKDIDSSITDVDIANHLNLAIDHLTEQDKVLAVNINFKASILAKYSTAFKQALILIESAQKILSSVTTIDEALVDKINLENSNLLYLNGKYDECEKFSLEKIELYKEKKMVVTTLLNQLVIQYTAQGRYADSISTGRQALGYLGIELPSDDIKSHVEEELHTVSELIKDISIPTLADKEEMVEEDMKMAMAILINLDSPCYLSNIELYCIVVAKMVQLSINYGPVPESAKGYASYGIVLCAYRNYKLGYEFNELGNKIADRYQHLGQICRSNHTMANHVQFWTEHIKEGDKYNDKGFIAGHDAGEYLWAGFIKLFKPNNQFWRGRNLLELNNDVESGLSYCQEHPNQIGIDTLKGLDLIIRQLSSNNGFSEEESTFIENCKSTNSLMSLSMFLSVRTFTLIIDGEYNKAQEYLKQSLDLLPYSFSVITNVYDIFSEAFFIASSNDRDAEANSRLKELKGELETLSKSCPENFKHIFLIILGLEKIGDNKFLEGTSYIEEAATVADQVDFPHISALAYELLAEKWFEIGKTDFSNLYFRKAKNKYQKWGAISKVNKIENNYNIEDTDNETSHISTNALISAYELMGEKQDTDELYMNMLHVMIDNLNATNGAILLSKNSIFELKAQYNYEESSTSQKIISYVSRRNDYISTSKSSFNDLKIYEDFKSENRSILCFPLPKRGVIYLQNDRNPDAFNHSKIELFKLFIKQLSYSLDHSEALLEVQEFNAKLEQQVEERTTELKSQRDKAEKVTKSLQDAQRQLISAAKEAGRAEVASNVLHNVGNAVMTLTGYVELLEAKLQTDETADIVPALLEKINTYDSINDFISKDPLGSEFTNILTEYNQLNSSTNDKNKELIEKVRQKIELVMKLIKSERQHIISDSKVVENIDIERLIDDAVIISDLDTDCKIVKNLETHDQLGIEYDNIKNIIINFFSNAKKSCSKSNNPAEVFISAKVHSNSLTIEVEDNGIGMTPDILEKVFEPGFSTKDVEGSGFGLHNSAIVAKAMDGEITAYSDGPGLGAKFSLTVPLHIKDQ